METADVRAAENEVDSGPWQGKKRAAFAQSLRLDIVDTVERFVVSALRILIILLVIAATGALFILFVSGLPRKVGAITSSEALLAVMQTSFAGVLSVVLGLELAETLKAYFTDRQIRLEVILVVATIAVSRQLIQVDFAHVQAAVPFGFGVLILCLTLGYALTRKASFLSSTKEEASARGPATKSSDGT